MLEWGNILMLNRAWRIVRTRGFSVFFRASWQRLRAWTARESRAFAAHGPALKGKRGLEIGGPSRVFQPRGIFPAYALLSSLDNVDYRCDTEWSKDQQDQAQVFGQRWFVEANNLHHIPDAHYDCVLSSHMLEHSSNPVAALMEWHRVLKPGGMLILVLPDPTQTFDHRRPVTTMKHLIEDYQIMRDESDLTHLPEILRLHDLARDPDAPDSAEFRSRCESNGQLRCMHHHVFDLNLCEELLEYCDYSVLSLEQLAPHHMLVLGSRQ